MFGRLNIFIIFLILMSATVFALEPEEKVYFDQLNQKTIAQLSQKIDSQTNQVERDMKQAVDNAKNEITTEVNAQVKTSLKSITIGLAGLIIVTLAIFKVVDLRLSSTRNIKKYEDALLKQQKEYDELILKSKNDAKTILAYRNQLLQFHQQVNAFARGYGVQPMPTFNIQDIPEPPKTKRKGLFSFLKRKKKK